MSVQSNLGGGINGHLGIFFSQEYYEEDSQGTPYERPLIPASLRIPTNTTIHKTQSLQAKFKEVCLLYRETFDAEKILTKKIVALIEKIPSSDREYNHKEHQ